MILMDDMEVRQLDILKLKQHNTVEYHPDDHQMF